MKQEYLDNIISSLKNIQAESQFTSKQVSGFENLAIEVKNVGSLKFPLKPAQAKALIKKARPAKYGLKDQTVLDTSVRDVWEIPKSSVKIDKRLWNKTLNPVLDKLKKDLGLTQSQTFKAQLHNLLIYEKEQFFHSHQDTEKAENMLATLVVLLPSKYRGGTLIVENQGDSQRYTSTSTPQNKLTFIAFYADCQHEVKPVTEGYRVALTYNLIVENSASDGSSGSQSISKNAQQQLDYCIHDYFSQPAEPDTRSYRPRGCKKLVYLLDHEYSAKGIKWSNLKANDQIRAQALLNSAAENNLDIFLTLADIHESWSCESNYDDYYSRGRRRYWDYEEDDDEDNFDDEDSVQLIELIEDDTTLRHWIDVPGKKVKYPDLSVRDDYICWTKANNDCEPFEKEYEGYMGNWGNTMDYWYHRGAIVMWSKQEHYNVMLEFNPSKVIDELLKMAQNKATLQQAQETVATLINDWKGLENHAKSTDYNRVLKVSLAVNDQKLARALVDKLDNKAFSVSAISVLLNLEKAYGVKWCLDVLEKWHTKSSRFSNQLIAINSFLAIITKLTSSKNYSSEKKGSERKDAEKNASEKIINWMLGHQWQILNHKDESQLKHYQLARLEDWADERMEMAKDLLKSCLLSYQQTIHDQLIQYMADQPELYSYIRVVELFISLKQDYQQTDYSQWGQQSLITITYERLLAAQQQGGRKAGDWSIMDKNNCTCNDCTEMKDFLQSPTLQEKIWPLNKSRRQHIHNAIDNMRLPVTHQTKRTGSPHKLVLTKTTDLFKNDQQRMAKINKAIKLLNDNMDL